MILTTFYKIQNTQKRVQLYSFLKYFFKYENSRLFVFFFQYFLDLEPFRYMVLSEHHKSSLVYKITQTKEARTIQ